jgi:methionyl aminopeptidase
LFALERASQYTNRLTGSPSASQKVSLAGGKPAGAHLVQDGDGCLGEGSSDEDGDGEDGCRMTPLSRGSIDVTSLATSSTKKTGKTRKRRSKKKSKKPSGHSQSSPPRIPLDDIFLNRSYPPGEFQTYPSIKAAEARIDAKRHLHNEGFLRDYRKAAEVHRQTRQWVQRNVKPGQTLLSVAEGIEDSVRSLLGHAGLESGDSLKAGMGFPTGLCLNNQTAHYTPNPGQPDVVLKHEDVVKVDFGVHINGWIVDSAFTLSFDPTYDNLLAAAKEATNTGIRVCDPAGKGQ